MANGNADPRHPKADNDPERLLGQARVLLKWSTHWTLPARDYPMLRSVCLYPPKYNGADWLVVLRAYTERGPEVAFHKGKTALGTIAGAFQRHFTNGLHYKPDRYAQG